MKPTPERQIRENAFKLLKSSGRIPEEKLKSFIEQTPHHHLNVIAKNAEEGT
ncbi:hypothetical protein HZC09_01665 [Candidatus Micrarchaeota archaeon]|nr:hypothetical protein [Candidatus Micrarchaeota archaeon]